MATLDPRFIIKNIVNVYVTANPVTKDDDVTTAYDLHLYERGPEDLKHLFFTEGVDVLFLYGEPRVRSIRPIQDVPVHYLMDYPVTVVTVDKHAPPLGALVCTSSTLQTKARAAIRVAVANSAQSAVGATPAYTLMIETETGSNQWSGGLNLIKTEFILRWTLG